MPELSVVVPVYNAGNALKYSIKSILNQTYKDFELIIVDDGSTDESGKICDNLAEKDARIRVIHKQNCGAGSARNVGIIESAGRYITFPDADDICKPTMFGTMIEKMRKTDADVIMCSYENVVIDEEGNIRNKEPQDIFNAAVFSKQEARELWFRIRAKNISILNTPWNKIYKREIIINNKILFPDIRRAQDAIFNLYYYDRINSAVMINEPLYCYRINNDTLVGKKFPKDVYECFLLFDKTMVDIISNWDMYYGKYKSLCDNHLLGVVDNCVNLCNNPVWNLSKQEKIKYLNNLCTNEYLQDMIKKYEGNVREIEDLIVPLKKKKARQILKVLNYRKKVDVLKRSCLGIALRKVKKCLNSKVKE